MVFDGHSDLLYDVTRRRLAGEDHVLERHHLGRLRHGGVEGMVLALWTSAAEGETFWRDVPGADTDAARTEKMAVCALAEFAESPWLAVVRTAKEAERARADGKMYAFLAVEGMAAIGEDLSGIDRYHDFGARIGMLTWNEENLLATGVRGDPQKGLSLLGWRAVRRMRELGMVVDVSHLNDGGFWDVMKLARGPVIASHSNCRALCDVRRNLTDDQLRAIRDTGGVVGINLYADFVGGDSMEQLIAHIERFLSLDGEKTVALGGDLDGCEALAAGFSGVQDVAKLYQALEERGYPQTLLEDIFWNNWRRIL